MKTYPDARAPLVSVGMITYNHERFLRQALESVFSQKFEGSIEVVLSDDCSTDGTLAIAKEFADKHAFLFRLLKNKNRAGVVGNFVRMLEACRGEYIALLEGDDYWTDPSKLRLQVDFLNSHPDCVLCHHCAEYRRDEDGILLRKFPDVKDRVARRDGVDLAAGNFIQTCSTLFRRKALPRFGNEFRKLKLGDWPLFALLSVHGWIGYLDRCMAVYRIHEDSYWSSQAMQWKLQAGDKVMWMMARSLRGESRNAWCRAWWNRFESRLRESEKLADENPAALLATWRDMFLGAIMLGGQPWRWVGARFVQSLRTASR